MSDAQTAFAEAERRIAEWKGGRLELSIEGLATLPLSLFALEGVTTLDLDNTQITDAGARDIAQMQWLKWLSLDNTQITDVGARDIAQMQGLTELSLNNTQITDAGARDIAQMQELMVLYLDNTQISVRGLWAFRDHGLLQPEYDFYGLHFQNTPASRATSSEVTFFVLRSSPHPQGSPSP